MPSYGLIKSNGTQKIAYSTVSRWNDGIKRHNLYTCCGTSANPWAVQNGVRSGPSGIPNGRAATASEIDLVKKTLAAFSQKGYSMGPINTDSGYLPTGSFDALVAAAANKALFNWVPISYPASAPMVPVNATTQWWAKDISMGQSISVGIAELKSQIMSTPGTFALLGMSQGSAVISGVMNELLTGSLTSRYGDCIGAVAFGNPCRQPGKTFPGGTDPGGAGVFPNNPSANLGWGLNQNTPDWWWEMATPYDPITTIPLNDGGAIGRILANFILSYEGGMDKPSMIENMVDALNYQGNFWKLILEILTAGGNPIKQALDYLGSVPGLQFPIGNKKLGTAGMVSHILYGTLSPPTLPVGLGLSPGATYADIALAYINSRGAAIAPR